MVLITNNKEQYEVKGKQWTPDKCFFTELLQFPKIPLNLFKEKNTMKRLEVAEVCT